MACFQSPAQREAQARNDLIKNAIKATKKTIKKEIKLLLLGAGESGKSTIVKQMKIINGGGYGLDELNSFIPLIFENVAKNTTVLIEAAEEWNYPLLPANAGHAEKIWGYERQMYKQFQTDYLPACKALWNDPAVQKAYSRRNEIQLNDCAKFYFDRLDVMADPKYVPDEQDVLRSRVATTGIVESTFEMKDTTFRMIDVGGQRSERRKWIHCFEDVTSITFIAAVSGYDQVCIEDNVTNRMEESISLWETIVNYAIFSKASMILFLNKVDILADKVATSNLKNYFPDFEPGQSGKGLLEDVLKFFGETFIECVAPDENGTQRAVYTHPTNATDTKNMGRVLDAVRNTILETNLRAFAVA